MNEETKIKVFIDAGVIKIIDDITKFEQENREEYITKAIKYYINRVSGTTIK